MNSYSIRKLFWLKLFNKYNSFSRVWSVRFNASYDQLVVTCSSDQRVILSNLPSIASQPFGTLVDQEDHEAEKVEKEK